MTAIGGTCPDRYEPLRAAFEAIFANGLEAGASVAVVEEGELVVDLWGEDTVTCVWSTTKTMTALSVRAFHQSTGWQHWRVRPRRTMFQLTEQFSDENNAALDRVHELRHEIPDPPVTWRCHEGAWERWSWLDSEFAAAPAPAALVAHAAAASVMDDVVLVLDDAQWRPESDAELAVRVHRHDEVDLGEPDDLGQAVRHEHGPVDELAPDAGEP